MKWSVLAIDSDDNEMHWVVIERGESLLWGTLTKKFLSRFFSRRPHGGIEIDLRTEGVEPWAREILSIVDFIGVVTQDRNLDSCGFFDLQFIGASWKQFGLSSTVLEILEHAQGLKKPIFLIGRPVVAHALALNNPEAQKLLDVERVNLRQILKMVLKKMPPSYFPSRLSPALAAGVVSYIIVYRPWIWRGLTEIILGGDQKLIDQQWSLL